ncbi:MAG: BlaI/MecI/CopY family transcriptional regulator [candidate division KSB1 bacterium]|nr:BlaI/MecI/CopY family transcriptional regulator [candidate division KSB1 bacterium]MDZ7301923.1 BlaI/MecI/CopY family transcriptional regulator [candidate division KSB1 bacterium]MDZ7314246.1 BlaI/MecI/CopY family transcriptional regulator [candidate division KSB1 bacterium]
MAKRKFELSASEWEIMQAVWNAGKPLVVRDVLDQAYPNAEKAYTTVQTLMNILVDKGFLKRKKVGMVNFYTAAVTRENVLRRSLTTLAGRMFQGSFGAMASFLVNSASLRPEEIRALRKLLDEKAGEQNHE